MVAYTVCAQHGSPREMFDPDYMGECASKCKWVRELDCDTIYKWEMFEFMSITDPSPSIFAFGNWLYDGTILNIFSLSNKWFLNANKYLFDCKWLS